MEGYNLPAAVDTKDHIIVMHEVINLDSAGIDLIHLPCQPLGSWAVMKLRIILDRRYFSGPQIKECSDESISAVPPKTTIFSAGARVDSKSWLHL